MSNGEKTIICPEHGAMLCYGHFEKEELKIYRCSLGRAVLLDSQGLRVGYLEKTHREYWVYDDGRVIEVKPNTPLESGAVPRTKGIEEKLIKQ